MTLPSAFPIRIIVTEDESSLRRDLVDFLNDVGHQAVPAASAGDMQLILENWRADIIILDINLPDGNGYDLARQLKATLPVGIIMLTCRGSLEDRVAGMESGADIYLVKDAELREIDAAVRNVYRRFNTASVPLFAPRSIWRLQGMKLIAPPGTSIPLTAVETVFLRKLMAAGGTPLSRIELLDPSNPRSDVATERSVDSLVHRLRRKVEQATNSASPIGKVYGHGYLFSEQAEIID
jgi:two-component system, OmpR family, response regulator